MGGWHCMTPACIRASVTSSLTKLQVQVVDLVYLHNAAEMQLQVLGRAKFLQVRALVRLLGGWGWGWGWGWGGTGGALEGMGAPQEGFCGGLGGREWGVGVVLQVLGRARFLQVRVLGGETPGRLAALSQFEWSNAAFFCQMWRSMLWCVHHTACIVSPHVRNQRGAVCSCFDCFHCDCMILILLACFATAIVVV